MKVTPTNKEQIISEAVELLKNNSEGIRYSQLINKISENLINIPINTIRGTIWDLDVTLPKEVYKPDRGLFRHISFKESQQIGAAIPEIRPPQKEETLYQPFADYLQNDLEECTKAIKLGGSLFGAKWGTPDVIGIKKSMPSDIIKQETEIISAEIKIDPSPTALIFAFGQACAYKLFSHKVYIVIPKKSSDEDKSRLESLCQIFGIGLILADTQAKAEQLPFEIRVRAAKHEPDSYYVNKYMKLIEKDLFG